MRKCNLWTKLKTLKLFLKRPRIKISNKNIRDEIEKKKKQTFNFSRKERKEERKKETIISD